ncbi:histidine phosphatase family protein [Actinomyces culturomici]|uniref:histidine phosphatase family protein n=1 Tax=Actinomyces culturomici TaxID=1926276 RepID=UPI000E1FBD37|nr:histidine phosphatase family protein [Actinomyces culturomici]
MRLVLVRHGQTYANRARALDTSRPGLPLTAEGLEQAEGLAGRWESEIGAPPLVVAVSPLLRTRQTAAPLCAKYRISPLIRPGVRELRSGDVEMNADLVSDSIYVEGTGAWAHAHYGARMGGGETGAEVLARALPVVAEVGARTRALDPSGVGAIIAHGAVIRLLATALAKNLDGALVMAHFMGNTGTVDLEWPDRIPADPAALLGALRARTWNSRPVDEWE